MMIRMGSGGGRSAETRQRLLDAAGEVFAEHGFRNATIQEICRRADANIAAVNYHFSDKQQLYHAVIRYAESCVQDLPAEQPPGTPAEDRLRAHVEWFLHHLLDEGQPAWHGKLVAREMIEPTPALDEIVEAHIRESQLRLDAIIRDLLGPGASADQVRRCTFSVVGQCLFYHHCEPIVTRLYPGVDMSESEIPALAAHVVRFSLAGIRDVAATIGEERS
jgi:TetR/AcrR family transcriptional regulator, regulator of cefoperazone and chloramphenicol sensitivity